MINIVLIFYAALKSALKTCCQTRIVLFLFQLAGDAVPLWSVRFSILEQITLLSLCLSTPWSINR